MKISDKFFGKLRENLRKLPENVNEFIRENFVPNLPMVSNFCLMSASIYRHYHTC